LDHTACANNGTHFPLGSDFLEPWCQQSIKEAELATPNVAIQQLFYRAQEGTIARAI